MTESTAFGGALMAGLAIGIWNSLDEIKKLWKSDQQFIPIEEKSKIQQKRDKWMEYVKKV